DVDSVSGRVELLLPRDVAFRVKLDTVSGRFECDFDAAKDGNVYTYGSGGTEINIDTVSGGVHIGAAE
ncbi:MAG: DUF4097 family beta strand repeat protein, partial [Clostridia bacterium]|nr:DUF4097 family beta strand repeat protein [Clostridia bacterium]